jgi:hypothetical protein
VQIFWGRREHGALENLEGIQRTREEMRDETGMNGQEGARRQKSAGQKRTRVGWMEPGYGSQFLSSGTMIS